MRDPLPHPLVCMARRSASSIASQLTASLEPDVLHRRRKVRLRAGLQAGLIGLTLTMAAVPAAGQTTTVSGDMPRAAPQDDIILVTGSRIARRGLDTPGPAVVIGKEEFELAGAVNIEQLLNTLPQVVPGYSAFSNNPGGGIATLDLRGIGQQRTLILVNGRRYIFFDSNQIVDANTIPQFLIEAVDVVTGGGSAVYGSDAVAGVVNFRLREHLEGLELGSQYALTGKGDGTRWNINMAFGTELAGGKGHLTFYADYFDRKTLSQSERAFSRQVMVENADDSALVPGGSASVPGGRYAIASSVAVPAGNGLSAVTLERGVGNMASANGALYTAPGQSRPYVDPDDGYNFAQDNFLQVPQQRWLVGTYGHYEVSPAFNPYFEIGFARNRIENEVAPTPVTGTFAIATDNPFLSDADRAALVQTDLNEAAIDAARVARGLAPQFGDPGFVNVTVARRVNDITARNATYERDAWRALIGTSGEFGSALRYDAYYLHARTDNKTTQRGNISRSAFAKALRENRLNIFGPDTISQALGDEISATAQSTQMSRLQVASASISGDLFTIGSRTEPVGFAAGAEWRRVDSEFEPSPILSSGDVIGFNAGLPTKGGYSVKELFGEVLVPLVAQAPFVEDLTVKAAARFADYGLDGVGAVVTWAAGFEWAPIRDIRLRGQYQKAIRAPNVGELYGGQAQSFPSATDPCSGRSSAASRTEAVRALCIATGVPEGLVFQNSIQPNAQIETLSGGNPLLREENSETFTAGVVLRPSFVPGLTVSADYFDIGVEDYIAQVGGGTQGVLNLCYYLVQDAESPYCRAIARDPLNGQIGGEYLVTALRTNISQLRTSGVDLEVDYTADIGKGLSGSRAHLGLSFLGTWTRSADYTDVAELRDEVTRCKGGFGTNCDPIFGDPIPEYRFTARATWVDGPMTASLRSRYIGPVINDRILNGASDEASITVDRLKAKIYTDLALAADLGKGLTLILGVNNLFDVKPSQLDDANDEQAATYPSTYDVLGRDFFVSARMRF